MQSYFPFLRSLPELARIILQEYSPDRTVNMTNSDRQRQIIDRHHFGEIHAQMLNGEKRVGHEAIIPVAPQKARAAYQIISAARKEPECEHGRKFFTSYASQIFTA
jgi:hypothetical protein